jgi:hypothetical protein
MRWAGYVARMGEWRNVHRVLMRNQKEREHFEDQGVDGKVGSEWILRRLARGIEWIELAQDRGRWRALVDTVMNLRVLAPDLCWSLSLCVNICFFRYSFINTHFQMNNNDGFRRTTINGTRLWVKPSHQNNLVRAGKGTFTCLKIKKVFR